MVEYNIKNDLPDAYLECSNTEILPEDSEIVPVNQDIQIVAIEGEKKVDCRIGFDTDERLAFSLTLKREGQTWTLKNFRPDISGVDTRDTENPKVDVKVGPDGQ